MSAGWQRNRQTLVTGRAPVGSVKDSLSYRGPLSEIKAARPMPSSSIVTVRASCKSK